MSDYGIQIFNSSGGIQIDSKYRNFSAYEDGSDVCEMSYTPGLEGGGGNGWNLIPFTQTQLHPIIAVRPNADCYIQAISAVQPYSGGSPSGWFDSIGIRIGLGADESFWGEEFDCTVPWILFTCENANVPSDDYGFVVKNSDGEVCFSSEESYLKILGVNVITDEWEDQTDVYEMYVDVTVNDALNNYFILTPLNFNKDNDVSMTIGMKRINSTTIRVRYFVSSYQGSGTVTGTSLSFDTPMILIEVNI